jgi:Fe-S oxidoreductase
MLSLFPRNADARRLSESVLLFGEYLQRIHYRPPRMERRAIVHGHCHQKAVIGMQPTMESLKAMGMSAELLDSGCCGMAGSFGFESGHYDVAVKVGEHALLPAVRSAPQDAMIVADGFSCREQIAQLTDRRGLHLAEVMAAALGRQPEEPKPARVGWKLMLTAAGAGLLAAALLRRRSSHSSPLNRGVTCRKSKRIPARRA